MENKIKRILDIDNLREPCYCCDYNLKGNKLAYGCAKSAVSFINLN